VSLLRKATATRRGGKPPPTVISLSTVATGSLQVPNTCKPYYHNGYYYAFFSSGSNLYYCYSSNAKTWSSPVLIASVNARWSVMGIDNLILLVRTVSIDYDKVRVGTIQADGTITWSSDVSLQPLITQTRSCYCFATKVSGVRKMFVGAIINDSVHPFPLQPTDNVYVSDDDGATWTELKGLLGDFTSLFWREFLVVPYDDGNKLLEIHSPLDNKVFQTYTICSLYRNGSSGDTAMTQVDNNFKNQYYLDDQAYAVLVGSHVHLVYVDGSNNLLHKRVAAGGSWETVGTVKTGLNSDAGVTLCYDSASGKLHIIYYEATAVKRKIWNGVAYGAEETLVKDEGDVNQLTAYPAPLNNRILLNWKDTANIRFALVRK
jgi:hypothetical protein